MSVCIWVLFYATARIPLHTSAYLCIPLCTSAYLCVPLPIPLYTSVYPCLGRGKQRLTEVWAEVNRGTHLCIPLPIPLYTSALGRGTQRYTGVLCIPLFTFVSSAFYHVSKSWFPGIIQKHGIKKQTKVSWQPDHSQPPPCQGFKITLSWQPGLN